MIFSQPIGFTEALRSSAAKRVLPTSATARELEALDAQVKARSRFMAQVHHVGTVATLDANVNKLLDPAVKWDSAQARLAMKQQLAAIGYDPENPPKGFEPAKPGSLRDISSDARLNLALDTNVRMAHGYARHAKANDPESIDDWPCWEFVRDQSRKVPRNVADPGHWLSRWVRAGGHVYGPGKNRLIARKDDPVWSGISAFGLPYPPFDYNSGMGVEEVSRKEAEDLGVIQKSTIVNPQSSNLNSSVRAAIPADLSPTLLQQVLTAFGKSAVLEAGQLILKGTP